MAFGITASLVSHARTVGLLAVVVFSVAWTASVSAQTCGSRWLSGHTPSPATKPGSGSSPDPASVFAMAAWDPDGPSGPLPAMLVVGGDFSVGDLAGVAMWDGRNWLPIGTGIQGTVRALAVTDTGDLVAGGNFTSAGLSNVARWRISASSPTWEDLSGGVDSTGTVWAIAAVTGGFVVGGDFDHANSGTLTVNNIVKWTDSTSSWDTLGGGVTGLLEDLTDPWHVRALAVLNRGQSTETLVVTGNYATVHNSGSAISVDRIARWDGSVWSIFDGASAEPAITGDAIFALAVRANGDLLAGGETEGSIEGDSCSSMAVFPAGQSVPGHWSSLGSGFGLFDGDPAGPFTIVEVPHGLISNADVIVGGLFQDLDGPTRVNNVARWSDSTAAWTSMGPTASGHSPGFNGAVNALILMPDGKVYAGGSFTRADTATGASIGPVAVWDEGSGTWMGLFGSPSSSQVYYDNSGTPAGDVNAIVHLVYTPPGMSSSVDRGMVVAGSFNTAGGLSASNIVKFDGADWTAFPGGTDGEVFALAVGKQGDLAVGGSFTTAGATMVTNVALWNDVSATWSPMGSLSGTVYALAYDPHFDQYYAGGTFGVAYWDGSGWTSLASNGTVYALAVLGTSSSWAHNGDLVAGGFFSSIDGSTANTGQIARYSWSGTPAWHSLDGGISASLGSRTGGTVRSLAVLRGSTFGGHIVAGGSFPTAGGGTVQRGAIARFDGTAWNNMGGIAGMNPHGPLGDPTNSDPISVNALFVRGNSTDDLVIGGTFYHSTGTSHFLVSWNGSGGGYSGFGNGLGPTSSNVNTAADVRAISEFSSGELQVGGKFTSTSASGQTVSALNYARWTDTGIPWFAQEPPEGQTVLLHHSVTIPVRLAEGYDVNGPLSVTWTKSDHAGTVTTLADGAHGSGYILRSGTGSLTISDVLLSDFFWFQAHVSSPCASTAVDSTEDMFGTCSADFNNSHTLTVQDIFDFLNAWFTGCPAYPCAADFNHHDGLTVQDIFDFLSAWFTGC